MIGNRFDEFDGNIIQLTLGRQNGNQTKGMNKNINAKAAPNVTGPYLLSFADKPV